MVKEVKPIFDTDKTKIILFSTRQMSQKHNLDKPELYTIKSKDTIIKREVTWTVLGMKFHQNSSWKDQAATLITEGYSQEIKYLTPFHVRKIFAESLILSRINYGIVLYAATGYVLMRYSNEKDVFSLNWSPIIKLTNFEISKLAHKALYNESWPNYLSLNCKKLIRDLRNNDSNMIGRSNKNHTFHENAEKVFNKLPLSVREKSN